MRRPLLPALLLATLGLAACAKPPLIPGTRVVDTKMNRNLIEICERYRHALEDRNPDALYVMASKSYFEDSGTPKADDDYGYEGLRDVIYKRLAALKSVRYNIEYRNIEVIGQRARIDIRYDASFQLATELGDRWERKQNEKRLEMEYDGKQWYFLAGM